MEIRYRSITGGIGCRLSRSRSFRSRLRQAYGDYRFETAGAIMILVTKSNPGQARRLVTGLRAGYCLTDNIRVRHRLGMVTFVVKYFSHIFIHLSDIVYGRC